MRDARSFSPCSPLFRKGDRLCLGDNQRLSRVCPEPPVRSHPRFALSCWEVAKWVDAVNLKSKNGESRKKPKERKTEFKPVSSHIFIPTSLSLFVPICTPIVTNWSQDSPIPTRYLSGTKSLKRSFPGQNSVFVNLFGGLWWRRSLSWDHRTQIILNPYLKVCRQQTSPGKYHSRWLACLPHHHLTVVFCIGRACLNYFWNQLGKFIRGFL